MSAQNQIAGTIREAARRYGLGEKLLRARVSSGEIPLYAAGCKRPRVFFADVERWLRSTRTTPDEHARARVEELLNRESER